MDIKKIIRLSLEEDAYRRDITTLCLKNRKNMATAEIVSKSDGVLCGINIAAGIFKFINGKSKVTKYKSDGQKIKKSEVLMSIKSPLAAVLAGERTALNFLQRLSGIATLTGKYVDKSKKSGGFTKIYDTRKTTPLLRGLEKYAVRCGGGFNHRADLSEMVLIKDNHIKRIDDLKSFVTDCRKKYGEKTNIEIECDDIKKLKEISKLPLDLIMLDNMNLSDLKKAILYIRKKRGKKVAIEISGGIDLDDVEKIARLKPDRISIGALTHSAPSLDISLEIK